MRHTHISRIYCREYTSSLVTKEPFFLNYTYSLVNTSEMADEDGKADAYEELMTLIDCGFVQFSQGMEQGFLTFCLPGDQSTILTVNDLATGIDEVAVPPSITHPGNFSKDPYDFFFSPKASRQFKQRCVTLCITFRMVTPDAQLSFEDIELIRRTVDNVQNFPNLVDLYIALIHPECEHKSSANPSPPKRSRTEVHIADTKYRIGDLKSSSIESVRFNVDPCLNFRLTFKTINVPSLQYFDANVNRCFHADLFGDEPTELINHCLSHRKGLHRLCHGVCKYLFEDFNSEYLNDIKHYIRHPDGVIAEVRTSVDRVVSMAYTDISGNMSASYSSQYGNFSSLMHHAIHVNDSFNQGFVVRIHSGFVPEFFPIPRGTTDSLRLNT